MENSVTLGCELLKAINYAMQQNYIPVIRNLVITNTSGQELKDIVVKISFDPAFAEPFEARLDALAPDTPVEISPVKINISTDFLFSLTEKIVASAAFTVTSCGTQIYSETRETELLAYNQSVGLLSFPELISAFVTPNHPMVTEVIRSAGEYLAKWDNDPSFTAYQRRNPNAVKSQMAAIYAALREKEIAYCVPPAGYENSGQRIRLADTVLTEKLGTCLDLSVLYASCLEAAGLNPLIIFTDCHAFCGCWLEERSFSECVTDDVTALTKRIAEGIDELCLVECTAFTAGKDISFDDAEKTAALNLNTPGENFSVIDIRRCRGSRIRPVPSRVCENGIFKEVRYDTAAPEAHKNSPSQIDMSLHGAAASANVNITRQDIWERKLLDLSLRNSLLNFRAGSSSVQLIVNNAGELEDALAKDESFRLLPAPQDFTLTKSDLKIYEVENGNDALSEIAQSEFRSGRIRTCLNDTELEKTLKKIHRQAKVSIEENGANTLYLALGFLRWYETEKSEKPRIAPLVLIPVDIVKKIQDKSYTIRVRGEEPQINVTILELLRQDFGITINGLTPLPADENGINLPLIFNTVRQGIMSMKRWDIIEAVFLGHFSFSRFIMWYDIKSRCDDLKTNKVVASLIDGKISWNTEGTDFSTADTDDKIHPSDLAVPTSADSSQLAAIYEASEGKSFVLHGPPGTGKSQTITNMIANALYHKKTVLFVAEKMAALSVVQNRLAKLGLDPFCLELHSNKAQKRAVLSQLEKTLNIKKSAEPEYFRETADCLFEERKKLNGTIIKLHEKQNHGLSLHETLMLFEENSAYKGRITLSPELIKDMNSKDYDSFVNAVNELINAEKEAGGIAASPLKAIELRSYTPEIRDNFTAVCKKLIEVSDTAAEAYEKAFGIKAAGIVTADCAAEGIKSVLDSDFIFGGVVSDPEFDIKSERINKLITAGLDYEQLTCLINEEFEASVKGYNAENAHLEWKKAEQKWVLGKALGQKKLLKEMAVYRKKGIPTEEEFISACERLMKQKQLSDTITSADSAVTSLFGAMWAGTETDFPRLNRCLADSIELRKSLSQIRSVEIIHAITSANAEGKALLKNYTDRYAEYKAVETELKNTYKVNFSAVYGEYPSCFEGAHNGAETWLENAHKLREYCAVLSASDKCRSLGLEAVSEPLLNGEISADDLLPSFLAAFSYTASNIAISAEPLLSSFRGSSFEDSISKFTALDEEFAELTKKELIAELSARVPDISASAADSSEIGILLKAIRSKGRMMPIRKLFDSIPTLLRRICPCMLMSPISVAQYIDPAFPKFDLVIFDEASQLPTCEAVGAIARGENVVVVGDPNQLPPTSFFTTEHTDEENAEIDDLESVLDDCLALAMPQKRLMWHYRSRHESLIAYSNAKYYENSLLTFPSPDDIVSRVQWIHVEGYYDKGGSKQNKAEAEAIVAEIVRRLRDDKLRQESIGVVTFSLVQQILIDDMLSEEFRNDPELERLANSMHEPILVKNLENVQGDERDVILFSIGYGPDKNGNVSMNFGPINRDGGWRRLNVAITRARKGMYVYSVISPDQIDLSRTSSEGVAGLKGFLEFARLGSSSLPVRKSTAAEKDSFAEFLAAEIRKMGYETKCNIGCSEYKIDIGVVNPDSPDSYILGIRCDGKRYLESGSARDRFVSQPGVLGGLGWNLESVWILDAYDNLPKVLEQVKCAIEAALHKYRNPEPEAVPEAKEEPPKEEEKPVIIAESKPADERPKFMPTVTYKTFIPETAGTPENFYEQEFIMKTREICEEIIKHEAPVSVDSVIKKTISAFGITRVTAKAEQRVREIITTLEVYELDGFIWKRGILPEKYPLCRVPAEGDEKRSMDEIHPAEISNAVRFVLKNQISMTREDLIRETAHVFGFTRMGGVIEAAANAGIDLAISRGFAKIEGDRITCAE
ncbi:MAG: DUF3320 domain-containing protein [Ruminiclostridium sp.]|nr:DUF3320 domain-containing protein [Ruminiclostridium sp.]